MKHPLRGGRQKPASPRQMRRRLAEIPLRDIAAPDLPYVTTLGIKLAELYADGDRFRLQEIAGQVSLLSYPYLDAKGRWQNAAGVEHLPLKVWHLVYYCEPKPASRKERRAGAPPRPPPLPAARAGRPAPGAEIGGARRGYRHVRGRRLLALRAAAWRARRPG